MLTVLKYNKFCTTLTTAKYIRCGVPYFPACKNHSYSGYLNTELFEVQISNRSVFKWSIYGLCPMY